MEQITGDFREPTKPVAGLPQHLGPNVFPNFPVFQKLLMIASQADRLAINDVTNGHTKTYAELLSDILHLRNAIWARLDANTRIRLLQGDQVLFNIIAPGSYEFTTGFLAILALGAIIVPISVAAPLEEASYFARTSRTIGVLTSNKFAPFGTKLAETMNSTGKSNFFAMDISSSINQPRIPLSKLVISNDFILDYYGTGLIIFTSGTTGPPKGAAKRRAYIDTTATAVAQWYGIKEDDVVLHTLPVHHATGIGITFLPYLLSGATIEFHSSGFDPAVIWDRWRRGGLTVFSGVPTMYMRLMRYFDQELSKRSPDEVSIYVRAARSFRLMMSGSAALPQPLQSKWMKILGGKRILERFGATEFNSVFSVKPGDSENPDGSVGKAFPGLDVRLSEGNEGEVLVKSPNLFTEYIHDPIATLNAFTSDGYYKTGDIARREGEYYFILGRASVDIIKSGGYKISALDIEREILSLDYVDEVMVVGLEDEEYGQRVAAAITLRDTSCDIKIDKFRQDLRARLAGYKIPTVLRVVQGFPKSASGKVVKKILKGQIFPREGHPDIQMHEVRRSKL